MQRLLLILCWFVLIDPARGDDEVPSFIVESDHFSLGQANEYRVGNFDLPLTGVEMLKVLNERSYEKTTDFHVEINRYLYFVLLVDNRSGITQTVYFRYPLWFPDTKIWLLKDQQLIPVKRYPRFGDNFYLDLPPGRHRLISMRLSLVEMRGKATAIQMMDFTSLVKGWAEVDPIVSGIYGAIIAMIFYNLAMYLVYRRIYFVFYSIYSAASIHALSFVTNHAVYDGRQLALAILLGGVSIQAFCHYSLTLKKKFPRLYKASWVVALLNIGLSGYSYITGNWIGFSIAMPGVMGFCFLTSVVSLRSGYRPAFYFVWGWGIFMTSCCLVMLNVAFWGIPIFAYFALFGFAFEISLFSFAIGQKVRLSEQEALRANHHAFNQLKKVFYPHQISRIKDGVPIEETMPTHEQEACAICFDIIGSSRIEATLGRHFIEDSIKACVSTLMVDYDEGALVAAGYRVKEVGDGFLCTVGYPFRTAHGKDPAIGAMELALRIIGLFQIEVDRLGDHPPVYCSIALAFGKVQGRYPKIGVAEYDVDGRAVDLAQRYEAFRQRYFTEAPLAHVITVHSVLFDQLPSHLQKGFVKVDLREAHMVVRDDPSVTHLYYRLLPADAVSDNLQVSA